MLDIGRINCCGHVFAPEDWKRKARNEINRLYFIHSGSGGYIHHGVYHEFKKGCLYFFPFLVDATLISDKNDKILHTYVNFELIPPIIADEVLKLDPSDDEETRAAISVFIAGGKRATREEKAVLDPDGFYRMYKGAVSFLAERITKHNGAAAIKDEAVIKAITVMHGELNRRIRIDELASQCFLTTDSFIRRFNRQIGVTPYAYLKKLRIRTAVYLRALGYSLEEIAQRTGYSDATSLLHAIKGDDEP